MTTFSAYQIPWVFHQRSSQVPIGKIHHFLGLESSSDSLLGRLSNFWYLYNHISEVQAEIVAPLLAMQGESEAKFEEYYLQIPLILSNSHPLTHSMHAAHSNVINVGGFQGELVDPHIEMPVITLFKISYLTKFFSPQSCRTTLRIHDNPQMFG